MGIEGRPGISGRPGDRGDRGETGEWVEELPLLKKWILNYKIKR